MFSNMKSLALAAVIGVGSIAALPAGANAGNIDVDITIGGGYGNGFGFGGYDDFGYGYWKPCTPGKALHKAKWMGLKKAYVAGVTKKKIIIAGKKYGNYKLVTFGKAPSCPVKW